MNRARVLLLAIPFVAQWCFGQMCPSTAAPTNPVYSVVAAAPKDPERLGAPIIINVTVTNISKGDAPWRAERPDPTYRAFRFLLERDGREVEKTAFHRKIRGEQRPGDPQEVESGSSFLSSVGPGKSFSFQVDLMRLYEITGPGIYALNVARFNDDGTRVCAKPLALTITQ